MQTEMVRAWFGHVERKSDDNWVSRCRRLIVDGQRGRGRGTKTWMECVVEDMERLKLRKEDGRIVWCGGMAFWGPVQPVQARK